MSTLDEIKAATVRLDLDEQLQLFRWWVETDTFKQRQLAALRRDLAAGIEDLESSRYHSYDSSNLMQLAEEVRGSGRSRLKGISNKPKE